MVVAYVHVQNIPTVLPAKIFAFGCFSINMNRELAVHFMKTAEVVANTGIIASLPWLTTRNCSDITDPLPFYKLRFSALLVNNMA